MMLSEKEIQNLSVHTQARLERYNKLRGKSHNPGEFWDLVVLTAIDKDQKEAYELQVKDKLSSGELPISSTYRVIADPPGPKIGNGGSTLFVINDLFNVYGEELFEKKVIIVHGGGFSQRLPSASILGKIFVGIPIGEPMYHSLDLKLATYVDFPSKIIEGGIFVCSADSFEVYDDCAIPWKFSSEGLTGLAHLSTVSVGKTHGVYVLKQPSTNTNLLVKCSKFLHKPPIDVMENTKGCIVFADKSESWVLTDSAFLISTSVTRLLLEYYMSNAPISCEIDAYGDFLQASGDDSTPSYTSNAVNVCNETNSLMATRKCIYNMLKGTPLYALVLAPAKYICDEASTDKSEATSIFYHIGTMHEFIENFSNNKIFRRIFGVQPLTSCLGLPYLYDDTSQVEGHESYVGAHSDGSLACKIAEMKNNTAVIMRSKLDPLVCIGSGSIIEYSIIGKSSVIGKDSIISGCHLPEKSKLPDHSFFHTIPILVKGLTRFITVAFPTNADMKKQTSDSKALDNVYHFGIPLTKYNICNDGKPVSLWNVKIFPIAASMEESYILTRRSMANPEEFHHNELYSMSDALKMKDLARAIKHRAYLTSLTGTQH